MYLLGVRVVAGESALYKTCTRDAHTLFIAERETIMMFLLPELAGSCSRVLFTTIDCPRMWYAAACRQHTCSCLIEIHEEGKAYLRVNTQPSIHATNRSHRGIWCTRRFYWLPLFLPCRKTHHSSLDTTINICGRTTVTTTQAIQ